MPWNVLGLDEESASAKDVKRAYARLLKLHRPDKDPEGFWRINDAYEEAKMRLEWRDQQRAFEQRDDAEVPSDDLGEFSPVFDGRAEPPDVLADDPLEATAFAGYQPPPEFDERKIALGQALAGSDDQALASALKAFNAVCIAHPACLETWGACFDAEFSEQRARLGQLMPIDDLLRELDSDLSSASHYAISAWQENQDSDSLIVLARKIIEQLQRYRGGAVGGVCARLAILLAIPAPRMVEGLANHAYENLPLAGRDWTMREVEFAMMRSPLFVRFFNEQQREFWSWRLCDPTREWDWNTAESLKMVAALQGVHPDWGGYPLLDDLLPEDVAASVAAARQRKRAEIIDEPVSRSDQTSSIGGGESWGCGAYFMMFMMFKALFLMGKGCDGGSGSGSGYQYEPSYDSPRGSIISKEELEKMIRGDRVDEGAGRPILDRADWPVDFGRGSEGGGPLDADELNRRLFDGNVREPTRPGLSNPQRRGGLGILKRRRRGLGGEECRAGGTSDVRGGSV